MIYNLDLFGQQLREIRVSLNLNQKDIATVTHIDAKTIRRIEYGKVLPRLDTLDALSQVYKVDLPSLLLEYRFDDYEAFSSVKNLIETKLDNGNSFNFDNELKILKTLLDSTNNLYYKNLIIQFVLLIEAILLYKDKNYNLSLDKLIEALKTTTPTYKLEGYNSFVYSPVEVRILMNMAFVINMLDDKDRYIEILEFCIDSAEKDNVIYIKLCHNLAGAYIRNNDFKRALHFSNIGIKCSQENRIYNGLSILFYGKGIAEYKLNNVEYLESLMTSIYLCKAYGQNQLAKTIIDNSKKFIGIDLSRYGLIHSQ